MPPRSGCNALFGVSNSRQLTSAISTRDLTFWQRQVKLIDALARNVGFGKMHAAKFLQRCQMLNSCIGHFRSPKIDFLKPFEHDKMPEAFVRDGCPVEG